MNSSFFAAPAARTDWNATAFAPGGMPAPASLGGLRTLSTPQLGAHERGIINGLAAYQLRYGKPDEALALLQLSQHLWPEDRQTLRLMTQAFVQIEDFESADMTEAALQRLSAAVRPTRLDQLRQAVIHFGRSRLSEARAALSGFLRANSDTRP